MKHLIQSEITQIREKRTKGDIVDTSTLLERIKESKFTVKDLGVNYRWIDHWYSRGLLIGNYEDRKWRKFNLIEYVWLKIIIKIREFNISLETVKSVKDILDVDLVVGDLVNNHNSDLIDIIPQLAPSGKEQITMNILNDPNIQAQIRNMHLNYLEMIILDIISLGNCYSILINPNGQVIPIKFSYIELYSTIPEFRDFILKSFISISLTEILKDFIIKNELDLFNKKRIAILSNEESEVLDTIRKDDLKSVTVRYGNDKKMNLLEEIREEKVDKAARLLEIIMKYGYQDITIKTQNGEIAYCENKRKRIFNKMD